MALALILFHSFPVGESWVYKDNNNNIVIAVVPLAEVIMMGWDETHREKESERDVEMVSTFSFCNR